MVNKLSGFSDILGIKDYIISDKTQIPYFEHPYINDGLIFSICTKGKLEIKINFREFIFKPYSILTALPHSVIEATQKANDLSVEILFFSFDLVTDLSILINDYDFIARISKSPCMEITKELAADFLDFHSFISRQFQKIDMLYRREMAQTLLQMLVIKLKSLYRQNEMKNISSPSGETITDGFIRLILKHYKEERNLDFYADKLCITPKYMSSIVKKITGQTAYFWLNEVVIIDAKFQLKASKSTVMQISEDLNFPSPSLFGRFFKKHTG